MGRNTDGQCGKNCKPEAMHSAVRHKCIFILCARPGYASGQTLCLRQDDKHIMSDYV